MTGKFAISGRIPVDDQTTVSQVSGVGAPVKDEHGNVIGEVVGVGHDRRGLSVDMVLTEQAYSDVLHGREPVFFTAPTRADAERTYRTALARLRRQHWF
jgi:hypothetical protein